MKTRNRKPGLIISLLLLTLSACGLYGRGLSVISGHPGKEPHRVPTVGGRIRVDGILDEEVWRQALKLQLKYEVRPGENIPAPVRTEVFLAHGNTAFYIGFPAHDPDPSSIRATFTDRDKITTDDWVSISLDTFNDQRRIYTFFCNPLGVQKDLVEVTGDSNLSWDTLRRSAGRIAQPGYIVEMSIPFRSLRFQREKGEQVWGFDVMRGYPRNLEHLIGFIPLDRNNTCYICQLGKMIGFAGVRGGKSIEIDPSISTVFTRGREDLTGGEWTKKESKLDPGITFQWSLTPNIMLSTAVNPDFSHVEADVAQLDINTQFALHYPEKRPFFLEGASVFSTPLSAIYTRSLADPDWGIKLTGKQGPHALGFYSVRDSVTNLVFPGSQTSTSTSIDMKSMGTVLRYRFDLGKRASTIGLLVTDREGDDYYNRLAGFDTYWRFTPRKLVNIQFLGSRTRYPRETAFLEVQPSGSLTLQFYTIVGNQIDFANRRQGRQIFLNPGVIYKAGRHFSISPDHIFERFDVDPGRLYTANVSNLLAVYQFNRRTFLRTILQYVNYDYNAGNYNFLIDPKFKHLFTQVMFSYKVNPQTVLFLGYSDDHFGSLHTPLTQANHTFFLKIGYAPVL